MEPGILNEMIAVIRADQKRREALLTNEDHESYYMWRFEHEPVSNELCLMLLVTLRHQLERELVGLAALAADDGQEISHRQYEERVKELNKPSSWKKIEKKLNLESFKGYEEYRSIEALRLLANSYKHYALRVPAEDLMDLLTLPRVSYAPLPESDLFREKLATFIGLEKDATYCDIAERFIDLTIAYVEKIKSQKELKLSKLAWRVVDPSDYAH